MKNSILIIINRRKVIIVLIAFLIIIGIVAILMPKEKGGGVSITTTHIPKGAVVTPSSSSASQATTSAIPTNQQFHDLIVNSNSITPDSNGQLYFGIINVKNPLPGWYVVTISVTGGVDTSKVIFRQTGITGNPLTIVAGPGTDFPPEYISLPDAVRNAL